jgi:DNA-binding NtrC family response regulator
MARVLVIDDEEDVCAAIRDALEDAGHHVLTAPNGKRAVALVKESDADVVITDIFMPESEGIETILALREACPNVKIIAMSAGGFGGTLDYLPAARKLGAVETIGKPFEVRALVALVEDVLTRPSAI